MAIRSSPCRQVENPATVPPPKPAQLGKTQSNIVIPGIGVVGERALTLVPSPGYRRRVGVLRCCRHLFWPPRQARSQRRTLERARTLLDGGQVRCCAQSCTGTNCSRTISRAWTFEVRPGFWTVPEVHRKHEPSACLLQPREPLGGRGGERGLELRPLQACPGRGAPLILHLAGRVFGIGHHMDCSSNDLSEWNRGLKRAARRGPYGNGAKQAWDKSGTIIPEVASRDPQHRGEAGSSATPFPASPSGFHRARAHRFTGRPHPNSTLSASCLRSGPAGHLPTSPGSRCRRPQLR